MAGRIRIGEILVRAGVIDQHQLNSALGEQRRWGKPLGATLVKLGFVEERDLVRALASQLSLPVASLEGKRIAPQVLDLVPASMAQENLVLPLFARNDGRRTTLFLAMEDPGDLALLDDLAFRTGMQVKPVMMAPSELAEGIDRYYRDRARSPVSPTGRAERGTRAASAGVSRDTAPVTRDAAPVARDAAPASSSAAAPAAASQNRPDPAASGLEELVRHFKPAEPEAASAALAIATPGVRLDDDSDPPRRALAVAATDHGAPNADIDPSSRAEGADTGDTLLGERHLAAPPPRKPLAAGEEALAHPPIESLASYDAKTRTILHALTHLLIDKGVITREEIHDRVTKLTALEP